MLYNDIDYPKQKFESLLQSEFIPSYNPFTDYFHNIKNHINNAPSKIDEFASYLTTDDNKFFVDMLRKHLVRAVKCVLENYPNRYVFVLVSEKQSIGKSWFIRFINPFGEKYYSEQPLRSDKDAEIALSENFIYNIEELQSMTYKDVNSLKSIISRATVKSAGHTPKTQNQPAEPLTCLHQQTTLFF